MKNTRQSANGAFDEAMWNHLPRPNYSKTRVSKLGRRLGQTITDADLQDENIIEAFKAFNDWRASHAYVVKRAEHEVRRFIKDLGYGFDVPNRLKRIETVRRKLVAKDRDHSIPLGSIYDLGGLRVVCDTLAQVRGICRYYHDGRSIFEVDKDGAGKNYIDSPQARGYRSHHFVLKFDGSGKDRERHKGQRVELQVRTRRQHVWATASEGMSFLTGCSFKHGEGDSEWHRLFALMSDVLAFGDGLHIDDIGGILKQVKAVSNKLGAISQLKKARDMACDTLEAPASGWVILNYSQEIKDQDRLQYFKSYDSARRRFEAMEKHDLSTNAVLLGISNGFKLNDAYPNYFLDMNAFTNALIDACAGKIDSAIWDEARYSSHKNLLSQRAFKYSSL